MDDHILGNIWAAQIEPNGLFEGGKTRSQDLGREVGMDKERVIQTKRDEYDQNRLYN